MSFWKSEKGQGAFEYILLLAGVLLIVVLVIFLLRSNLFGGAAKSVNETQSQFIKETSLENCKDPNTGKLDLTREGCTVGGLAEPAPAQPENP